MEHYTAGKVPAHLRLYYEPKVIRVKQNLLLAQFRYCPTLNNFRWMTFGHPVVKSHAGVNRQFLELDSKTFRINDYYNDGSKDGTTRETLFEDMLSFMRHFGVTDDGKIYVATPEVPIMNFGPFGAPSPPLKGI